MALDEQFTDLVGRFYDEYFEYNPALGQQMGFHKYRLWLIKQEEKGVKR